MQYTHSNNQILLLLFILSPKKETVSKLVRKTQISQKSKYKKWLKQLVSYRIKRTTLFLGFGVDSKFLQHILKNWVSRENNTSVNKIPILSEID